MNICLVCTYAYMAASADHICPPFLVQRNILSTLSQRKHYKKDGKRLEVERDKKNYSAPPFKVRRCKIEIIRSSTCRDEERITIVYVDTWR